MTNVDILYKMIDNGRQGKNIGLKTGLDKLDEYTGGLQKGIYTLIFGLSGAGKTAVCLYYYIYRPLKDNPKSDIKYIYFSLELSAELLLAKLLCLYLYEEFNVVISYSELMSWKDILTNEQYEYVKAGKKWLKSISEKLIIFDKTLTSKSFYHTIMSQLSLWGSFEEIDEGRRKIYIKNNPNQWVSVVVDHVGLITCSDGRTKKAEIDLMSQYAVTLKEKCQVSFFMLQQENRTSSDIDRIKAGLTESSSEGLKDTGNTFNDCEVCIGVYYPLKFKLKTWAGYEIINPDPSSEFKGLRDRCRGIQLIKNRHGASDKSIPVNFFGELGLFRALPEPDKITDYKQYIHLNGLKDSIVEDKDIEDKLDKKESNELNYSFKF